MAAKVTSLPLEAKTLATSVVVIGSGVAGLTCALALAPAPVILLTKTQHLPGGSSVWAQGGIAAAIGEGDSADQHAADTVAAGAGLVDPDLATLLAEDGIEAVGGLVRAGVGFDRLDDGGIALGREAAHGRHRIVHAGGDATGRALTAALIDRVLATPSIRVMTQTVAVDLISAGGTVGGVTAYAADGGWLRIFASDVVLATGGVGALWRDTTNPAENTGDGLGLAARAGAVLADLEFMQFHPTALDAADARGEAPLPLLTEALRGAGAVLVDAAGRPFMEDVHPQADLAPRDVVARAIAARAQAGERTFLDLRPALAARGQAAFPQALRACRAAGHDPLAAPVPITPAAHYHMGGVWTDTHGRTSLKGLWACGEAAATGVHGANRLASNSLLEGLVFGRRVAEAIWRAPSNGRHRPVSYEIDLAVAPISETRPIRDTLRRLMARDAGLLRDDKGLARALAGIARLQADWAEAASRPWMTADQPTFADIRAAAELANMLVAARLVVVSAGRRTESRGAHRRADFPRTDPAWARRQLLTLDEAAAEAATAAADLRLAG